MSKADYVAYHDQEWGVPVYDDRLIFEFLVLESAQAGLSWYTILRKRENFRRAFDNFQPEKVARYDQKRIQKLLLDQGIIRNRRKIEAAVNNARKFLDVQTEFGGFSRYIWDFVDGKPKVNTILKPSDFVATSRESDALSRDLKDRGFKFMGSIVCYSHMQATGMVNDHTVDCFRRMQIIGNY
jgi:DNA-3-methyladenine glycosylase I